MLVKKVVFPVEILPVTHVISGLGDAGFRRRDLHRSAAGVPRICSRDIAWLPALLIPQLFFTLGLAWFLSATGVYLRDLRPDDWVCSDALVLPDADLL